VAGRLLHRLLVIACQVMELGLHLTQDELELRIQARLALHDVLLVLLLLLLLLRLLNRGPDRAHATRATGQWTRGRGGLLLG